MDSLALPLSTFYCGKSNDPAEEVRLTRSAYDPYDPIPTPHRSLNTLSQLFH
jgi:hypothetical protein